MKPLAFTTYFRSRPQRLPEQPRHKGIGSAKVEEENGKYSHDYVTKLKGLVDHALIHFYRTLGESSTDTGTTPNSFPRSGVFEGVPGPALRI